MSRHLAGLVGLLLLWALLPGCATHKSPEVGFNPAWFARTTAASDARTPGRVALLEQPLVRDLLYDGATESGVRVQLPIGRIVAEAAMAAVGDACGGGAQRVAAPPADGSGFAATLVIEAVQFKTERNIAFLLPLPIVGFIVFDVYTHLSFDLRLLDARGRTVWVKTYDGGRELWKHPVFDSDVVVQNGVARLAHETAWRLSQQAAGDLREWLEAERMRPREL